MSIRVRRPQTDRLPLSGDDFIIVKRYLSAGEYREFLRVSMRPDGTALDPMLAGFHEVLAYLLDWSFTDADGRPLTIADQPSHVVRAALDRIDPESYMEVQRAIQDHRAAVAAAVADEKKTSPGVSALDSTSVSVG